MRPRTKATPRKSTALEKAVAAAEQRIKERTESGLYDEWEKARKATASATQAQFTSTLQRSAHGYGGIAGAQSVSYTPNSLSGASGWYSAADTRIKLHGEPSDELTALVNEAVAEATKELQGTIKDLQEQIEELWEELRDAASDDD